MKEATGEANMTVITIVIIALVTLIGTPIVMNALNLTGDSTSCASKGHIWYNGKCYSPDKCTTNKTTGSTVCK